jgi:hypothetical protein
MNRVPTTANHGLRRGTRPATIRQVIKCRARLSTAATASDVSYMENHT